MEPPERRRGASSPRPNPLSRRPPLERAEPSPSRAKPEPVRSAPAAGRRGAPSTERANPEPVRPRLAEGARPAATPGRRGGAVPPPIPLGAGRRRRFEPVLPGPAAARPRGALPDALGRRGPALREPGPEAGRLSSFGLLMAGHHTRSAHPARALAPPHGRVRAVERSEHRQRARCVPASRCKEDISRSARHSCEQARAAFAVAPDDPVRYPHGPVVVGRRMLNAPIRWT